MKWLLTLLIPVNCLAGWTEGNTIGVRDDNSSAKTLVFMNSYTGVGMPQDTWNVITTEGLGLPSGVKQMFASGILIITHGTATETCDMTVSFRAHGDNQNPGNYIGQVVEAAVANGQRSTMSTFIPVRDGKFEFYWHRNTSGQWPEHCAYGINLSLQAYVK